MRICGNAEFNTIDVESSEYSIGTIEICDRRKLLSIVSAKLIICTILSFKVPLKLSHG